jgi:hypothetical protein
MCLIIIHWFVKHAYDNYTLVCMCMIIIHWFVNMCMMIIHWFVCV